MKNVFELKKLGVTMWNSIGDVKRPKRILAKQ